MIVDPARVTDQLSPLDNEDTGAKWVNMRWKEVGWNGLASST